MAFGDVDEDEDDAGKQALDGAPAELAAEDQIAQTWLECEDEQGNLYYYNQQTGESAWTLPEGDVVPTVVPISILPAETRADLGIDAPADIGPGSPSERQLLNQDQTWEQTRSDENTKDTRSVTFVLDRAGPQEIGQEVPSSTLGKIDDNAAMSATHANENVNTDETSSDQLHTEEQKVQEGDATDEVCVEGKEPADSESQERSQQEQFARYRKESLSRLESLRGERNELADERDGLAHKLVATQAALQRAQLTVSNLEKELQAATKRDESIISGLRKEFESLKASNEQYAEYARVSAASLKVAQGDLEALRSNYERLQADHDQAVHEADELRAAASERAAAEADLEARTSDQLSQANDEASRLKHDLARLVEELAQAKRELTDTKSELKRAQGDLARTSETQAQTERRSEILLDVAKEEANQEIATQVASAREESAAQCKRAMAQAIGMLESQVQIAQDAHTKNALSKIVGLLAMHHEGNSREQQAGAMTAQQAQLDALATTIHDLQTRLAGTQTLEKDLEQASRRSQQLERQVTALTTRVEATDADTAKAVREVEQRSKYLEQELRAAIDEIEAGKVRESKLEAQEIKLRIRVQDLEAGNIQVPQYDPMLTKELSEARSSLATAQEDLHIARQDVERQHARLESLQASEAELKLALENAREEAIESAKRAEAAEAATQAAQEEAQALQGAAEEALAEVRHANAEASEVHGLLDVERRRHFQERTALLSELDLHKCAASARQEKAAKLTTPGEWHRLRLRARLDCDATKTLGAQVQQDLQNFAEVLRSAKRDLGERTRMAAAARAAAAAPEINNEKRTPRDDVYSIESLAVSPSPNQAARPESLSKRKTMAFCRIHPQICHIINSSVIMANREMLELCNAHGQTRRWTLQGVADSYVKNRQTFDTLRLSAFCFATDPRSVYCAILHGQRQAAPKLSLLGDLSDPGLLAQSLYGLVQQIGFANHDLALEVCRVDDRSSRLIFRTDSIACRSLRAAQALVDSLPVDPERTLVDERPASAPLVRRAKIKKVGLRKKLRKPKKTRRTKRGRGVAEDEEDGIAGNILADREEGMMYVHHQDGESEGEECTGDENDDEEDDGGCNRARNSQGRATSPAYHEVYTILVNDHPRIQFVALTRAVGPRPRHMGSMWANDGAEAVTSRLPGTGSIMDEIATATRAWQLGQKVSGRHPLLNQLNYLHAPAATVQLVTHVTQALKDADYSLLHLESAQAVLGRSS